MDAAALVRDDGDAPEASTATDEAVVNAAESVSAGRDALSDERRRVLGFTLQLLREFLAAFALTATAEALRRELEASATALVLAEAAAASSAELWFDMQQRWRAGLAGRRTGKSAAPAPPPSASTLEQLVAVAVAPPPPGRGGGRFALDVDASSASPLAVLASPKTRAFDGGAIAKSRRALRLGGASSAALTPMDAFALTRSPVVLPSQRRDQQPSGASGTAAGPVQAASGAVDVATGDDDASASSTSEPGEERGTPAPSSKQQQQQQQQQPSQPAASSSPPAKPRLLPPRRKKRQHQRSRRSPLPSPAYPRSPWANAAMHSNEHFASASTARVHGDFDSPVRRGSVSTSSSASLLTPEPALVRALDASLQRDLCAVRLVDRELRQLRLEKARSDASISPASVAGAREDAYARALELDRFGASRRVDCALCAVPFLLCNLPHRVSFKCVMDVHDAWGYAPPDRATAAKYRAPLCYDAVRVCRLCAPIVLQHAAKGSLLDEDGRSMDALAPQRRKPRSRGAVPLSPAGLSADPYVLPPLFDDDCMTERDALSHDKAYGGGHGSGGGAGGLGGAGANGGAALLESPAKTIVYANQTDATAFMSAKEWQIINSHRSSIRQVMEKSVGKQEL